MHGYSSIRTTLRRHLLAAVAGVTAGVLSGCVLAEVHFTASPIPPWVTLDVKGLDDRQPTVIVATQGTEPATTAPGSQPAK